MATLHKYYLFQDLKMDVLLPMVSQKSPTGHQASKLLQNKEIWLFAFMSPNVGQVTDRSIYTEDSCGLVAFLG